MSTESQLLEYVIGYAADCGLLWFHSYDSLRDQMRGWPDLVIVGHGILYRELKSRGGAVSAEQSRFGRALMAAGGNWAVWRPEDAESGRVQREMHQLALCPINGDVP